jgi:hypothetical protein
MVFGVGLGVAFLATEGLSLRGTRTLIADERVEPRRPARP